MSQDAELFALLDRLYKEHVEALKDEREDSEMESLNRLQRAFFDWHRMKMFEIASASGVLDKGH